MNVCLAGSWSLCDFASAMYRTKQEMNVCLAGSWSLCDFASAMYRTKQKMNVCLAGSWSLCDFASAKLLLLLETPKLFLCFLSRMEIKC